MIISDTNLGARRFVCHQTLIITDETPYFSFLSVSVSATLIPLRDPWLSVSLYHICFQSLGAWVSKIDTTV